MTGRRLNCGFLPLVDSAPLIIAHELGFATKEGVQLELLKQPSWSALRDLLVLGDLDLAHMLSPMPVAMSLGIGAVTEPVDALMVLSVNGNVVVAGNPLVGRMRQSGWEPDIFDAHGTAERMGQVTKAPLRLGVPFPISMHRELLEHWLQGRSVPFEIHSVPPPLMAEALGEGEVDAFCVGEPWGSRAVDAGSGEMILTGKAIWAFSPEKVLAARRKWIGANPEDVAAAMRAVFHAGQWLSDAGNRTIATDILARAEYLGLPDYIIERALTGRLLTRARSLGAEVPGFLHFHAGAANFPWRSQAQWIGRNLARRHGLNATDAVSEARKVFRADLYRQVMGRIGVDLPGASAKAEGAISNPTAVASQRGELILMPDRFFDGEIFDPGAE